MSGAQILPKDQTPYSTPVLFRRTVDRQRTPSFSSMSSPSNSWDSSYASLLSLSFTEDEFPPYSTTKYSRRSSFKAAGIPFSWEEIPGIPKHQDIISPKKKKEESSSSSSSPPPHLLPLPPPAGKSAKKLHKISSHQEDGYIFISPKKQHRHHIAAGNIFQRDPFFAALIECSKDDDGHHRHHRRHRHHDHGSTSSKITTTRSLSEKLGLMINMYTSSCKTTCTVSESIVSVPRSAA